MVESKEIKYKNSTDINSTNGTIGTDYGTDFKWSGTEDSKLQREVQSVFEKIRHERRNTEQAIYEAIKKFEWSTGIKIVKLDFEISRDKLDSKVKVILERI